MPGDFTYFRKFIILKDDYTSLENINPKGHGKIETRGNRGLLRLNLENCEKDQAYSIYFLMGKKGEVKELDMGKIFTDDRGKGRADISINLKDIELKGFPIHKVEALVVKRGDHIILAGNMDKDSKVLEEYTRSIFKETIDKTEELEQPLEEEEQVVEADDKETQEDLSRHFPVGFLGGVIEKESKEEPKEDAERDIQDVAEEGLEEEIKVEEVKQGWQEVPEELEKEAEEQAEEEKVIEETKEAREKETEVQDAIEEGYETFEPFEPDSPSYEQIEYIRRLNHKNQMTDYILSVLKYFPQVQPFKIYLHGYTWWRIDDDGYNSYKGFLPYYNYLLSADYKYPFLHDSTTCLDQIRKYGHYLFGIYSEGNQVKYYVYAIPGRFTTEEHPFKGITGFNTWYDSIDEVGYWILYIDPLMGKIIYPINPMTPGD